MSSWGCPHEIDGICQRVAGAICQPGMRGCVLAGKVEFPGGVLPAPRWPDAKDRTKKPPAPGRRRP